MNINLTSNPGSTKKNKTGGWRTYIPKTDFNKCISCGMCAKICPESAIEMNTDKNGKTKPKTNYDFCKGCGLCAAECPVKAIQMNLETK